MTCRHGPLRHGLREIVGERVHVPIALLCRRVHGLEDDCIEVLGGLGIEANDRLVA